MQVQKTGQNEHSYARIGFWVCAVTSAGCQDPHILSVPSRSPVLFLQVTPVNRDYGGHGRCWSRGRRYAEESVTSKEQGHPV